MSPSPPPPLCPVIDTHRRLWVCGGGGFAIRCGKNAHAEFLAFVALLRSQDPAVQFAFKIFDRSGRQSVGYEDFKSVLQSRNYTNSELEVLKGLELVGYPYHEGLCVCSRGSHRAVYRYRYVVPYYCS